MADKGERIVPLMREWARLEPTVVQLDDADEPSATIQLGSLEKRQFIGRAVVTKDNPDNHPWRFVSDSLLPWVLRAFEVREWHVNCSTQRGRGSKPPTFWSATSNSFPDSYIGRGETLTEALLECYLAKLGGLVTYG